MKFMDDYACQVVLISSQIAWTQDVQNELIKGSTCERIASNCEKSLKNLASKVLLDNISARVRLKIGQLITESVHQRDVSRSLVEDKICDILNFKWLQLMRLYLEQDVANKLEG